MKKLIFFLVFALLVGCKGQEAKPVEESKESENQVSLEDKAKAGSQEAHTDLETEEARELPKIYQGYPLGQVAGHKVLHESPKMKFELISMAYDEDSINITIDIENAEGQSLNVNLEKLIFDGIDLTGLYSHSLPFGAKLRAYHEVDLSNMELIGRKNVHEVLVSYEVLNKDWGELYRSGDLVFTSDLDLEGLEKLESETFPILESELVNIQGLTWLEGEGEFTPEFILLVENLAEEKINFYVRDLVVNGYAIDSYAFRDINPNTKGFIFIYLDADMLDHIGIDSQDKIKEIAFSLYGTDGESFQEVFNSGQISIEF